MPKVTGQGNVNMKCIVPLELWERFAKQCKKQECSHAAMIRGLIIWWLEDAEK